MVNKFIRGKATQIVITGVVIGGLAYGASRLELGSKIKKAAFDTGSSGGDVITQPIAGIVSSLTKGLEDIKSTIPNFLDTTGVIGADFQEFFTGNRDAIEDFFDGEQRPSERPSIAPTIQNRLSDKGIADSIKNAIATNSSKGLTNSRGTSRDTSDRGFGNFGSAEAQETAFQKTLRENMKKFPEWFK